MSQAIGELLWSAMPVRLQNAGRQEAVRFQEEARRRAEENQAQLQADKLRRRQKYEDFLCETGAFLEQKDLEEQRRVEAIGLGAGPKKTQEIKPPKKPLKKQLLQALVKKHSGEIEQMKKPQLPEEIVKGEHKELKVVDLPNSAIRLDASGFPTIDMIRNIVSEHWPELGHVMIKPVSGGANTGAIYLILDDTSKKSIFFCKVSPVRTSGEAQAWENLMTIQQSRVGLLIPGLRKYQDAPIITRVEKFFRYRRGSEKFVIEVTHAAQGNCVNKYVTGEIPVLPGELATIGKVVGRSLGIFHREFMKNIEKSPKQWKTVIHGDSHLENIFIKRFDAKKIKVDVDTTITNKEFYRVYFIDNETIKNAIVERKRINWDLINFIFTPMFFWKYIDVKRVNDAQWNNICIFYAAFLDGYISAFPGEQGIRLEAYIENEIGSWIKLAMDCVDDIIKHKPVRINQLPFASLDTSRDEGAFLFEDFVSFINKIYEYDPNNVRARLEKFYNTLRSSRI